MRRTRPSVGSFCSTPFVASLTGHEPTPRLFAGRVARTPAGLTLLTELAELLQAPIVEGRFVYRMNFPTRHPLKMALGTSLADADLVLALEHPELFHYTHTMTPPDFRSQPAATEPCT